MLTAEAFIARWSDPADAPDPAKAAELIDAATAWLQDRTGRYFGPVYERTDYTMGCACDMLCLHEEPTALGSDDDDPHVEIAEAMYRGAAFEDLTPGTDYVVRVRHVYRIRPAAWYASREYRLRYAIGYPLDTGPAAVREAVAMIATWLWNEEAATADEGGVRGEKIGDYSYTLGGTGADRMMGDIPYVWEVVRTWRRIPIA